MRLFAGGAEVPSWRSFLAENGVEDVSLSYMGLRRKVKFARPWLISEKFPDWQNVMLDSGGFTINKDDNELSLDELADIASQYMHFVSQNIDRLHSVTEFDALPLGLDWIRGVREDFWDDLGEKFIPVWHAEYGVEELERLASSYARLAVVQTEVGERDLAPTLNELTRRYGVKLHGLSMTKQDVMKTIRWDSVGSTRWIAPSQYGDTFVWTGHRLIDYPKKYKDRRKRHRTLFIENGFDAQKIEDDDRTELLRLSLWSWQEFLKDLNRRNAFKVVTNLQNEPESDSEEQGIDSVDNPEPEVENTELVVPREHVMMPGLDLVHVDGAEDRSLHVRGDSLRRCDDCFLKDRNCPGFKPGAECVYEFPLQVRTDEQLDAVDNGLIEMQTQRVFFMKMVEDREGGYSDPALSAEVDRLTRMIKMRRDGKRVSAPLVQQNTINVPANNGSADMMNRVFGTQEETPELEQAPQDADDILEATDVVESLKDGNGG